MEIEKSAATAIESLEKNGYEAYVVGGCVRDSLMGAAPHDWDICTSALPEQTRQVFAGYPVIDTGIQHGTITVLVDGTPLEITTFRTDGDYQDNRRPATVTFVPNIQEDLARRDFTINAMAYSPTRGLVDCFGGEVDLRAGILRSVGNPDERFQEDGLRILRALRFASRLEFAIAPELSEAVHRNKMLLANISAERISSELTGLLLGKATRGILLEYPDVLVVFMPEISPMVGFRQNNRWHQYDVWRHTAESVAAIAPRKVLRLAMLLHDIGKPACHSTGPDGTDHFYGHPEKSAEIAEIVLRRLRFDNHTLHAVVELVRWHDADITPGGVAKWMNRLGEKRFDQLLQVKRADIMGQAETKKAASLAARDALIEKRDALLAENSCFKLKDLAVDGKDLLAAGVSPGVAVGKELNRLLELVMEGRLSNEKTVLLGYVHKPPKNLAEP